MNKLTCQSGVLEFAGHQFETSRPHGFGLVINGPASDVSGDYLHDVFLVRENREAFLQLIETEGLVVCKQVKTKADSYRKVRGKSSHGKLSQAEYYHHDGCSCPTKPRVVEIRMPFQKIERQIATSVAPFPIVMKAMLDSLPARLQTDPEITASIESFAISSSLPPAENWDKIQGRITRLVRRDMDAESCREYFRSVDQAANAYDLPWEMGESRLMLNSDDDLSKTMQHRRAYQQPRGSEEQNGSLVKRWTAEEV